jgi:hypothetical protein
MFVEMPFPHAIPLKTTENSVEVTKADRQISRLLLRFIIK